jgi:hypothetical protein
MQRSGKIFTIQADDEFRRLYGKGKALKKIFSKEQFLLIEARLASQFFVMSGLEKQHSRILCIGQKTKMGSTIICPMHQPRGEIQVKC